MSGTVSRYESAYASALADYVKSGRESSLEEAHGLGRQALAVGLSVLDVTELHHRNVQAMTGSERPVAAESPHERALPFLLQSLAALDMATRGFVEAAERVAVEQAHVERLQTLADLFVEMRVEQSVDKRLLSLAEDAARLVEVHGVHIRLGPRIATAGPVPPPSAVLTTEVPSVSRPTGGVWDLPTPTHWLAARLEPEADGADDAGTITVWRDRSFTAFDEALLVQFARLSSTSVRNALLYEHEHQAALTLQSSLLPASVPAVDGLAVQVRYRPSGARVGVGGDWYDVIELSDERVGLVIGDVMGHGLAAAAFMGQLRVALRAYASECHSPSKVLERADWLLPTITGERIATVIYGIVEPDGQFRYANAGHPPPLVVQPGKPARFLVEGLSAPIGVGLPHSSRIESAVRLEPGARLVLYTDGLIERRERHLDEGLDALQEQLSQPASSISELCDEVLTLALESTPEDDICLLAVQLPT